LEVFLQECVDSAKKIKAVLVLVEAVGLVVINDPLIGLAVLVECRTELLPMP
jgi:hypothetical protein